ncbi:ribbon-helix-helix domain-containing protein [Sphaerothrix gracilis]|uniref:ribbon-helix-helix domain-containing protein n=1 Tax=Sphaerothrix gracilis TaxID=3151835 RepID=UPI0031FBFFAD
MHKPDFPKNLESRSPLDKAVNNLQSDDAVVSPLKPKRMSISLPADIAGLLEFLAETQGISQNEALRRAIATEAYIQQEIQEGATILIQKPNKQIKEVVFR